MSSQDTGVTWIKSSYSTSDGGNCVEIGHRSTTDVAVRDSKAIDGPTLAFMPDTWQAFVGGVQRRAFSTH